ncbi:short-chain dehydrogenase/reductase family protein [Favolaschia claudopus]|uniref:Short-chain dehydrogenase/reductase family protein n=1 Tax=Favolaschia claudopus TaxID=2862362 RepID=A0AAW0BT46_9AGAR
MSLPEFSSSTTGEEAADALAAEIQGKNVLITGTSVGGIGFETARVIAKHANLVVITGYSAERLKVAEDAIKKDFPSANIRSLVLDLSSLAAIRKAAAEVNSYSEPLHVLINNAAAPIAPFELTVDNLERQTATDHIGPFLFTKLLAPKLLASASASPSYTPRVVFLSSTGHAFIPGFDLSQVVGKPDAATYHPFNVYSHVKAANVLMAIELSKRSGGKIKAYSLCPGLIFTNIHQKEQSIEIMQAAGFIDGDKKPSTEKFDVWKSIPQGATTTVVAAFDPRLNDHAGAYLSNGAEANKERAAHSSDPATAEKLWTATEEIVGEKFTF